MFSAAMPNWNGRSAKKLMAALDAAMAVQVGAPGVGRIAFFGRNALHTASLVSM